MAVYKKEPVAKYIEGSEMRYFVGSSPAVVEADGFWGDDGDVTEKVESKTKVDILKIGKIWRVKTTQLLEYIFLINHESGTTAPDLIWGEAGCLG